MSDYEPSKKTASLSSYIAAVLFLILLILFSSTPQSIIIPFVGVAFHLMLFPVVRKLPAPEWARAAGYGWLVLDLALNVAELNGVDQHITMPFRLGGHISSAVWIVTASLRGSSPLRVTGILQGIFTVGYSLLAPWVPNYGLYPSALLLLIWLVLSARELSKA